MSKIQVFRQIDKNDKTVLEALAITERFKVLPYYEVEKILDTKATDFSLSRNKAKI